MDARIDRVLGNLVEAQREVAERIQVLGPVDALALEHGEHLGSRHQVGSGAKFLHDVGIGARGAIPETLEVGQGLHLSCGNWQNSSEPISPQNSPCRPWL